MTKISIALRLLISPY